MSTSETYYLSKETSIIKSTKLNLKRRRQHYHRTYIYPEQKEILKEFYKRNPYPDPKARRALEQMTGLPPKVITTWYRNYRRREESKE